MGKVIGEGALVNAFSGEPLAQQQAPHETAGPQWNRARAERKTERTQLMLTPGAKEAAKKRADSLGISLNEYILGLIEWDLKRK